MERNRLDHKREICASLCWQRRHFSLERDKVLRIILVSGLLSYGISIFLPWFWTSQASMIPEISAIDTLYWSFRAELHIHHMTGKTVRELLFLDYWFDEYYSYLGLSPYWITVFASQILTVLLGPVALLMKSRRNLGLALSGSTIFFSALSLGLCILQRFKHQYATVGFPIGFWIASFASALFSVGSFLSIRYAHKSF